MTIETSSYFERRFRKVPRKLQEKALERQRLFSENPFNQTLETHKLHGKESEHWAFSITQKCRIKFLFLGHDAVLFIDIGNHDEVY